MKKGKILIFLIIIIYSFIFVALYYYKDSSDKLNNEKFKRDFKKSEALKIGFFRAYGLKLSDGKIIKDTMTEEQVIKYLGISQGELVSLIEESNSNFPYSKGNGTITFKKAEIDKWLEKCHVNALKK